MTTCTPILATGLFLSLLAQDDLPSAGSVPQRPAAAAEERVATPTQGDVESDLARRPVSTGTPRVLTNADLVSTPTKPATARVYTNADLEQLHELRGETGVLSQPVMRSAPPAEEGSDRRHDREERYWRREAAKARDRVAKLSGEADAVRERIAAAEALARQGGRRRSSQRETDGTSLRARLLALEARMRLVQDDLEERARREGALPGWLR